MRSLAHFIRYILRLDSAHSQVSERELQMLLKYSRNAKVICEIGCYEGKTSIALARNTAGAVYSVDPFLKGRLGISYGGWIARLHRKRSGAKNLFFLRGFSKEVAPTFHLPIDFLFIDADHSYEAIKTDWNSWCPKMAEGGIIALHDSRIAANSPIPLGTMRFYAEDIPTFSEMIELDSVDSLAILQVGRTAHCGDNRERIAGSYPILR
jgi:predicted O-methyltransferase YrrM